jgi:DNA-binding MarR family transcriptional regulator
MNRQATASLRRTKNATPGISEGADKPLTGTLCFELRKTSGAVMGAMTREFGRWNLKPSEATLLTYIGANPGCTQSAIAQAFRVKAANLVPLIARLERDGLLERVQGSGRAIAISLCASGTAVLENVEAGFERLEEEIGRALDAQQRELVIDALRAMCKVACHYVPETV